MKRLFLTVLAITAISSFSDAQDYNEPIPPPRGRGRNDIDVNRIRFGAYLAPNISWMKPTASKSDDGLYRVKSDGSRVGFTWGLLADYFFTENYGIATGFQLNSTGGKLYSERIVSEPNRVQSADFTYYLQYAEVPFNLKLRSYVLPEVGLRFFGQFGLTAGVNISKKATYSVIYLDGASQQIEESETKEKLVGSLTIAPVMLQLNIGGGIEKPITDRISGYVGLFFNNGFLPDATDPGEYDLGYSDQGGDFSDGNIRLNSFAIRFGIFF